MQRYCRQYRRHNYIYVGREFGDEELIFDDETKTLFL